MNKIQRIQKLFHTDKWWGRVLLLSSFYLIYLILGYWFWFLFSGVDCLDCEFYLMDWISPIYFIILLPILSFIFIFKINIKFNLKVNKIILFFVNLIIILLNLFLFFIALIFSIKPNFF